MFRWQKFFKVLSVSSWFSTATCFSFQATEASSCGDLTATWTGGQAPYTLTIIPIFGVPTVENIPNSSFSNGKGTYNMKVSLPPTPYSSVNLGVGQYMVAMGDAAGPFTGGVTPTRSVGNATNGATCNTTSNPLDFGFELNSALQQCRVYEFTIRKRAVKPTYPVSIYAIVPGGGVETLSAPSSPHTWITGIAGGTPVVIVMTDYKGLQGGCSQVLSVGLSDDATCLRSYSPSVTALPPSSSAQSSSSSSKLPVGAYLGLGIGSVIAVSIGAVLIVLFTRRSKNRKPRGGGFYPERIDADNFDDENQSVGGPTQTVYGSDSHLISSTHDLAIPPPSPFLLQTPSSMGQAQSAVQIRPRFLSSSSYDEFGLSPLPSSPASTSNGKGGLRPARSMDASGSGPRRIMVHTDIEESQEEVEELPPSYREWKKAAADETHGYGLLPLQASQSSSSQEQGPSS